MSTTLQFSRIPVIVYKTAPGSFYDSVLVDNVVQSMAGATVDFSVRPLASRAPLLDAAAAIVIDPPDNDGNNVRYDWTPTNITTLGEGDFMAWWGFALSGFARQESPEFPVLITDHGPGLGTQTGAIVDGVAAFMPLTLNALRKDSRYGDLWLQQQADVIKYRVLGQSVPADDESQYHLVLLDFLSKRLALGLTKPGIEWWSRQQKTRTSTQTQEVASYPDMIASLNALASRLTIELEAEWRDLLLIVPGLPQRRVSALPATSFSDQANPANWRVTANPQATERLLTGGRGEMLLGTWFFP